MRSSGYNSKIARVLVAQLRKQNHFSKRGTASMTAFAERRAEVEDLQQHHLLTSRGFTLIDIVVNTGLYSTVQAHFHAVKSLYFSVAYTFTKLILVYLIISTLIDHAQNDLHPRSNPPSGLLQRPSIHTDKTLTHP